MTTIDDLLAAEAIRMLKARYFRGMDTKDWKLLSDLFTEHAICDYSVGMSDPASGADPDIDSLLEGRPAILAYIAAGLAPLHSVHQGFMPEITITGPDSASAIWPMADLLRLPPDSPVAELRGYGHYYETYRKDDGQWRIATLRLTRLRLDHVPK